MPFQIRRGTEAERVSITPAVAEPIFTTDTNRLYVGNGVTPGGIRVSGDIPESINDLSDVSLPPSPNSGDVLTWNGSTFTASPVPPVVVDGSDYNINIVADDSTKLVDTVTKQFNGNLVGNVTGNLSGNVTGEFSGDAVIQTLQINGNVLGDGSALIFDRDTNTFFTNLTGNVTGQLFGEHFGDVSAMTIRLEDGVIINADSSVLLDSSTNTLYANVVGDVTGNLSGNVTGSFTGNASIDILQLNDQLVINGDIVGEDSSVILERNTRTFFANLNGDVVGSVFMDDSTKIIDGITGSVSANGFVQFGSYTSSERPAGVNGMVIYNSTANRFQGFQNGSWINIDDGSAA